MTRKIQVAESTQKPIRVAASSQPRVEPQQIEAALGAEASVERLEEVLAPVTLLALREELASRRQPSGGRPGLSGVTRRVKIPLSDKEWLELEELAAAVSSPGFAPSAGQVASVLLTSALRVVATQLLETAARGPGSPLGRELAALTAAEVAHGVPEASHGSEE